MADPDVISYTIIERPPVWIHSLADRHRLTIYYTDIPLWRRVMLKLQHGGSWIRASACPIHEDPAEFTKTAPKGRVSD